MHPLRNILHSDSPCLKVPVREVQVLDIEYDQVLECMTQTLFLEQSHTCWHHSDCGPQQLQFMPHLCFMLGFLRRRQLSLVARRQEAIYQTVSSTMGSH